MKLTRIRYFFNYYYLAIASFVIVLLLTLLVYQETYKRVQERNETLFTLKTSQVKVDIENRMRDYIQILKGGKALYKASESVTRNDWEIYVKWLQIEENYPGIQGIGFAPYVRSDELLQHIADVRAEIVESVPNYAIFPEGKREVYAPVSFIEPFTGRNLRAFGFDMFSDPRRREAMERARDSGNPVLSGKVQLIQEDEKDRQPGFLIYLPVFAGKTHLENIADRRRLLKGFVYCPFRANDLFKAILGNEYTDIDIEVYDGTKPTTASLLFDTDTIAHYLQKEKQGRYQHTATSQIAGNTWTLYFTSLPAFENATHTDLPAFILQGGALLAVLVLFIGISQANVRKSNHLKQTITDNATAALFMMDANGYCTFMNPAAEHMTGYTFEEIRQQPLHNMIHHTHPDGTPYPLSECPIDRALPTNNAMRAHEDVFIRKGGEFFNVTCAARPIFEAGIPVATVIEVRDITKEKRARIALSESEARFRSMADSAPVMIWIIDADRQCTYLNKQWLVFTGQTLEQGLGRGWQAAMHPDDREKAARIYLEANRRQAPFRLEYRLKHVADGYKWVVSTGSPRFHTNQEFIGYIGSVIDISEIKEAENKIKKNALLLQKVFEQVPAIVGLIEAAEQKYILVNPILQDMYENRELLGKTVKEAHPGRQGKILVDITEEVFRTGKPFSSKEMPIVIDRNLDGNLVTQYFNIVFQPLLNEMDTIEAIMLFAVDVTELVTARQKLSYINQELSRKNQELTQINNDLDSFVYTASHDLKAPIANLEGLSTMLRRKLQKQLGPVEDQLLTLVQQSINKLQGTIRDLAEITKVQKEKNTHIEPVLFADVLRDVTEDIRSLIEGAKASITIDLQVKEVLYARKNLRSIMYNLLSNAVKYRSPDRLSQITISTRKEDDHVVLYIQDNGLGLKPNQQEKLFSMFKRFHTHVEGTGIGLYIIKRIIENNGGSIEVESEYGVGTVFKVYFHSDR
jgi:PAS domain S-box-containing protein